MTRHPADPRGNRAPGFSVPEDTRAALRALFLEQVAEMSPDVLPDLWIEFSGRWRPEYQDWRALPFDLRGDLADWMAGWNLNYPWILDAVVETMFIWSNCPELAEVDHPVWSLDCLGTGTVVPDLVADGPLMWFPWEERGTWNIDAPDGGVVVGGSRRYAKREIPDAEHLDLVEDRCRGAGMEKPTRVRDRKIDGEINTPTDRMRWLVRRCVPFCHGDPVDPPRVIGNEESGSRQAHNKTIRALADGIGIRIPDVPLGALSHS